MGENKEKLCLQRKERTYLSFQSCPGVVSSSLSSHIPSSPSHGYSNSKPERETHFRFSFKENGWFSTKKCFFKSFICKQD